MASNSSRSSQASASMSTSFRLYSRSNASVTIRSAPCPMSTCIAVFGSRCEWMSRSESRSSLVAARASDANPSLSGGRRARSGRTGSRIGSSEPGGGRVLRLGNGSKEVPVVGNGVGSVC